MPDPAANERPWFAMPVAEVLERLAASPDGLSDEEAELRLARAGPNRLPTQKRSGVVTRLLLQFNNVLVYVLIAAAIVSSALQHWVDAGVILGAVLINAVAGFIQEGRAERAIEAVRSMLSPQATVLRGGRRRIVLAERLVPGDVVVLQSGDKVPADLRLVRLKNLQMTEAILTGESLPAAKAVEAVSPTALLGERACMAYSGTIVGYGHAHGVVVATGPATEIGRISAMLVQIEESATPLMRKMRDFGRWLTAAILALAACTFAIGAWLRGYPPADMFMAAVGIAVAAIPEGLPAIVTIVLAIGVQRMARRNAIVRRLPAVETLGAVTVICSDKTGTLTRNELTVRAVNTACANYAVDGTGYAPRGGFARDGRDVAPSDDRDLVELLRAAALCNDAVLLEGADGWHVDGDPTEGALIVAARKAGLDEAAELRALPRTDAIPFESDHRFMATLHHDHAGHGVIYVKGAPERLLELRRTARDRGTDRPLDVASWRARIDELAGAGQRVLAVAAKATGRDHRALDFGDVASDLTLLGVLGLIDPPREEAIRAVAECRNAGIAVKMITGDHAATALAIARELGIPTEGGVLTGRDLDELDDAALRRAVSAVNVFARTSPAHKLRLVDALQGNGHVVAMTGDGVNDAPALKRADIGVAMGRKGTEAAKEAAGIVLADDDFATIAAAVREGRVVYDNLKKTILYTLPTNGGEAITVIAAILLGTALPVTPVQILWINLVTETTLSLAFAFEAAERDVMARPPRPPKEPILSGLFVWRVCFVALLMGAAAFGLFLRDTGAGVPIAAARTAAVNTVVVCEIVYLFSARFILESSLGLGALIGSRPVLAAAGLIVALQLALTHLGPLQGLFGTTDLDAATWGRVVAVGVLFFFLVETEKAVLRRRRRASIPLSSGAPGATTGGGGA